MENLAPAFEWAIQNTRDANTELWRFQYGAWLAGRGQTEDAIRILSASKIGVASALLARLYQAKGDARKAAAALEAIQEPGLHLHPQGVLQRDKILHALGTQTHP